MEILYSPLVCFSDVLSISRDSSLVTFEFDLNASEGYLGFVLGQLWDLT